MKPGEIFTRKLDGKMLEIGNWEARSSSDDVFIGMPLSDSRLDRMQSGRQEGKSDSQIFRDMHPVRKNVRLSLSLEELTLHQLGMIAQKLLNEDLSTLKRMAKPDLIALVRRLAALKNVTLEIAVGEGE